MAYRGSNYLRMNGGLDLRSSAMQMDPGRLLIARNVECMVPNGYRRTKGYEARGGGAVTGTGAILGVAYYAGKVYAFRSNGSAVKMYSTTGSSWVECDLGRRLNFTSGGPTPIQVGDTIVGATGGATAVVKHVYLSTGSWAKGDAAGTFTIYSQTGSFQSENLNVGAGTNLATIGGNSTAVTLSTGGTFRFEVYPFGGTEYLYGVDGVNPAFQWDGTTFVQITSGMASNNPDHVIGHKNHLILAFGPSVQISPFGEPTRRWSVVVGAGEILTKGDVTGFMQTSTGALLIFGRDGLMVIDGSSPADYKVVDLREYGNSLGAIAGTQQQLGSRIFWLSDHGIVEFQAGQQYGDFQDATLSQDIQPLLDRKRWATTASTVIRDRNQYRLFFNDGTGIIISFYKNTMQGITEFEYPHTMTCAFSAEAADGSRVFMGDDAGNVFELTTAGSFAGTAIQTLLKTAYASLGSPRVIKRWRHVILDMNAYANANFEVKPDYRFENEGVPAYTYEQIPLYGSGYPLGTGVLGSPTAGTVPIGSSLLGGAILGGGGAVVLGGSDVVEGKAEIEGRGDYVSLLVYSTSTASDAWELSGLIYEFLPGRRRY